MKKSFKYWMLVLLPVISFGQKQIQEGNTTYQPLIPTSKVSLLKDVDVIFFSFSDINIKFYTGYIAKKSNYSSYAENNFNAVDCTTEQLSFGIIAPLLVL